MFLILHNPLGHLMKKTKSDTLIIIPAHNEAWNIQQVLTILHETNSAWDLLVINDASTDETGKLARETNLATVIDLPVNLGIGGTVQTGFKYACRQGYQYALQFDADGQHIAAEIFTILRPLHNNESDVVIGSRFKLKHDGYRSTFLRRFGIRILKYATFLLIEQQIKDNTSGFRAYNRKAIEFLAKEYPTDYPEPEAIILLGKNGFSIKEVFTEMQPRLGGVSSIMGNGFFYMMKVLLAMIMTRMRPNYDTDE